MRPVRAPSRPSAPSQGANRRGFTLIEILLALTLSGLVVLLAHRVFAGVMDGAARLREARVALDRDANARRFLQEAFGSLDVAPEGTGGFAGWREQVEFTTWQRVAAGWLERRRMALGVEGDRLVARVPDDSITLWDGVSRVELDYLLEPGASSVWVWEWISPVSAPLAVRVRIAYGRQPATGNVDTLLFLVGPRG